MSFWENKNVLVTGSTGFVGRHLSSKLKSLGANVFSVSRNAAGHNSLKADILDYAKIKDFVEKKKINIWFFNLNPAEIMLSGYTSAYKNILELKQYSKISNSKIFQFKIK